MSLIAAIKSKIKNRIMYVHSDLVKAQQVPVVGDAARMLLWGIIGVDIPQRVKIGKNFILAHGGNGVVFYHGTEVGDNVLVYQGVTVGLRDLDADPGNVKIVISDNAILCAGCKVLSPPEGLTVGRGTVVGANAVLTCSTGENEVWAGVPAKRVRTKRPLGNR
jgi:serine O-acetyltransferase